MLFGSGNFPSSVSFSVSKEISGRQLPAPWYVLLQETQKAKPHTEHIAALLDFSRMTAEPQSRRGQYTTSKRMRTWASKQWTTGSAAVTYTRQGRTCRVTRVRRTYQTYVPGYSEAGDDHIVQTVLLPPGSAPVKGQVSPISVLLYTFIWNNELSRILKFWPIMKREARTCAGVGAEEQSPWGQVTPRTFPSAISTLQNSERQPRQKMWPHSGNFTQSEPR